MTQQVPTTAPLPQHIFLSGKNTVSHRLQTHHTLRWHTTTKPVTVSTHPASSIAYDLILTICVFKGLLYNLWADKALSLNFVPQSIYDMQSTFYSTVFNEYGVYLDTRHTYTKGT